MNFSFAIRSTRTGKTYLRVLEGQGLRHDWVQFREERPTSFPNTLAAVQVAQAHLLKPADFEVVLLTSVPYADLFAGVAVGDELNYRVRPCGDLMHGVVRAIRLGELVVTCTADCPLETAHHLDSSSQFWK